MLCRGSMQSGGGGLHAEPGRQGDVPRVGMWPAMGERYLTGVWVSEIYCFSWLSLCRAPACRRAEVLEVRYPAAVGVGEEAHNSRQRHWCPWSKPVNVETWGHVCWAP